MFITRGVVDVDFFHRLPLECSWDGTHDAHSLKAIFYGFGYLINSWRNGTRNEIEGVSGGSGDGCLLESARIDVFPWGGGKCKKCVSRFEFFRPLFNLKLMKTITMNNSCRKCWPAEIYNYNQKLNTKRERGVYVVQGMQFLFYCGRIINRGGDEFAIDW